MTTDYSRTIKSLLPSLIMALSYPIFCLYFVDFESIFEIDPDEGYNTIKALMLEQGLTYNNDFWSDQPPLYSYLLWGIFNLFGWEIQTGRLFTLFFSSIMLFALSDMLRLGYDYRAAVISVLCLIFSYYFVGYSVAIMLGLPSIALAVMSFWAIQRWLITSSPSMLGLSGILIGLSIAIKLFTFILIPILLFVVSSQHKSSQSETKSYTRQPLLSFLIPFFITLSICFLPAILSDNPLALFNAHVLAADSRPMVFARSYQAVLNFIWRDIEMYFLVLIALGFLLVKPYRTSLGFMFALWLIIACLVYMQHYPVWRHHVLMLSIPASALAGIAVANLYQLLRASGISTISANALVLSLPVMALLIMVWTDSTRPKSFLSPRHYSHNNADIPALNKIETLLGEQRSMVTSRQIFAFKTNAYVPGQLSVTSKKRFLAGLLSADDIIHEIKENQVEVVILNTRWKRKVRRKIRKAIQSMGYTKKYSDASNNRLSIWSKP